MKAVVLYATMTGHSRKIARSIAEKLDLAVFDLQTQPKLPPCDWLILVSGIYGGESKAELLDYIRQLPPEQAGKVLLVTSSTRKMAQGGLHDALSASGHTLAGEYLCKGSFLFMAWGHPNAGEIEGAVQFVKGKLDGAV